MNMQNENESHETDLALTIAGILGFAGLVLYAVSLLA